MAKRAGKRRAMGLAALAAAAIAFPLGLAVGGRDSPPDRAEPPPATPAGPVPAARNRYSARIGSDPYVISEQRKIAEALELSCRQSRTHCAEAREARLRIEEAEGS